MLGRSHIVLCGHVDEQMQKRCKKEWCFNHSALKEIPIFEGVRWADEVGCGYG